jgi:chemotaxis protein histidine kinase CheA
LAKHQQLLSQLQDWSDPLKLNHHSELDLLVQSLVENAVQLEATTDAIDSFSRQSSQILEKQSRLLTSAQEDLLEARMVPLGDIFSILPRVLQQLETLHNKPVALRLSGTEVLVDKAVVDKLYDPLLHLVRNAFDHGIEPQKCDNNGVRLRKVRSKFVPFIKAAT